jgi:D-sedoheptulose 7-phosphate isomerase
MSVERIQQQFRENADVHREALDTLAIPVAAAIDVLFGAVANGSRILACGNGGSAANAQRLATTLVGQFERERPGLPAIALDANATLLTAISNDSAFEAVYAKQVRALGQAGDVLVVISTSGNSVNLLAAIQEAHEREMFVIAMTGNSGGVISEVLAETDIHICVPSERAARIQEVHLLTVHCLCDGIDAMLLGDE